MWYVLFVILFGANPTDTPVMLKPQFFATEPQCETAGKATAQAIKDANLQSVAGVVLACKVLSNPVTEHSQ